LKSKLESAYIAVENETR